MGQGSTGPGMHGKPSVLPHRGGRVAAELVDTVLVSGGAGMKEEIVKVPVRGSVLEDANGSLGEDGTM
jgi:hypothetical protein